MEKSKKRIFKAMAELTSIVTVDVEAESLEQALAKAKKLTIFDFLNSQASSTLDEEPRLTGVYE